MRGQIIDKRSLKKMLKNKIVKIATLLALVLAFFPSANASFLQNFSDKRILVKFAPKANASYANYQPDSMVEKELKKVGIHIIPVGLFEDINLILKNLNSRKDVIFAEEDKLVRLAQQYPNDPRFPEQWHMVTMRNNMLWFPMSAPEYSGSPYIIMANCDTGVFTDHEDLRDNAVPGWNMYDANADTSDVHGHGTMTAGCMVAIGNNSLGIAGTNWHSRFMPIRVSDTAGLAFFSVITSGIIWAKDHGARIVSVNYQASTSLSVSSGGAALRAAGGLLFVAAGNGGLLLGEQDPNVIVVAGTNQADGAYGSYGNSIDISAPATNILTLNRAGGYSFGTGTSFASPTAAGLAAIIWSINPYLTPDEVEAIIKGTSIDLGPVGWDDRFGTGRIDFFDAASATPWPFSDILAPLVWFTNPHDGDRISHGRGTRVDASVYAFDNDRVDRVEFYVGGILEDTDTEAPYEFSVVLGPAPNSVPTSVEFKVKAYDSSNNVSEETITLWR